MLSPSVLVAAGEVIHPALGLAIETINEIYDKQSALKEARELCASLTQRIISFVNELLRCGQEAFEQEELLVKLELLLKEFLKSVVAFTGFNLIQRVLQIKSFEEDVKKYNEQLDRIIIRVTIRNTDKLAELTVWRKQFEEKVEETLNVLKGKGQRDIWMAFKTMGAPTPAIENLLLEAMRDIPDESDPERTPEPLDAVLRNIIEVGEKHFLGGKRLEKPPNWFVTDNEVETIGNAIDAEGTTTIFRGEWQGVQVAVKKFNVANEENPVFNKHFRIWNSLHHPHLAQLYGAGSSHGAPFFIYEYASRQSLNRCWKTLSDNDILRLLHQAALGLMYLHSKHIVHGNVNSSKLLVTDNGMIKIFGFNTSYIREDNKSNSLKVSSREDFAAPECIGITRDGVFRGDRHSPRFESDVYSFGLTIIEAMTRQNPFYGKFSEEIRDLKQKNAFIQPSEMNDEVWALVKQMCVCDWDERVSFAYVADELRRLATSVPAAAAS
ncbi:hypothetical protein Poli38472_001880 [Pythium oligandrum]|uniref:Protein kinase domain-containing protein n=1 Tax=Pythium oligandrum TaxID=41045 RepID=A0A8K1CUY7_PYTOL|nr:hypothetical protein Poli38472_001880 [Pythium oligandrum]|eukprot:TMW69724.1 hypothetical protein Poli38472_001880 [Pythium oligandrum]